MESDILGEVKEEKGPEEGVGDPRDSEIASADVIPVSARGQLFTAAELGVDLLLIRRFVFQKGTDRGEEEGGRLLQGRAYQCTAYSISGRSKTET